MEELQTIKELLANQRPVAWDAMPDIALYMDQVVSYMRRQTMGEEKDAPMTSAMINNYIKDGLVPRAQGKRYGREHLVYLTAIALLKNVLSVRDMKLLLGVLLEQGHEQQFYEKFLSRLDDGFSMTAEAVDTEMDDAEIADAAMTMAIASCGAKLVCEQMLAILRSRQPEHDGKEGKREKDREKEHEKAE